MPNENQTVDIQTLTDLLKKLVTQPEDIHVTRHLDEQGVLLSVKVDPKDMGIVIGRNGIMANSIKTILRAIGKANDMNIRVEFLEPDGSLKYSHTKNNEETKKEVSDESTTLDTDLDEFVIN